ncbi:1-aminocyclopropane-1-carboxylate oxidase 1-like protein [Cinnamomum micranthum f. kanehirae]|uniref:1-aminocyclopropane-1-carboxylate oxidase 1-like protein n=1 Tax=Cinnamomum micranthum f. kanehirae TaxID=337451 RepID=A0A443N9A9_9MAGN|nr:1-aminocyclopropane-1-carboxylate oxidase 1-like protein [Cinnamomum micranthum f. kanehirae]
MATTMNSGATDEYDRAKEVKEFDESKIGCKGLVDSGATTIPRFFIHPPQSLQLTQSSSSHLIPTIDLSHADSHRRSEIVHQIREASQTWGFFQVTHHGIPSSDLHDTISAVRSFYELPMEVKSQHYCRGNRSRCQLHDQHKSLPVRCCYMVRYAAGKVLMGILSEGLGLERRRLEEMTSVEASNLVVQYYPYCPQPDLTLGLQSHTDPVMLTVVLQNRVGGLQVKHGEEWVEVKPMHGALVVNIGDLLQIISNDQYKSVHHLVLANPSRETRISIPVFFNPSKRGDTDFYGPLLELLADEKPALYRNFTMGEVMGRIFSREMGNLRNYYRLKHTENSNQSVVCHMWI